jgi:SAM-dependent methyltransferase
LPRSDDLATLEAARGNGRGQAYWAIGGSEQQPGPPDLGGGGGTGPGGSHGLEIETAEPGKGTAAWWDDRYQRGDIPWDTGVVPPEVVELVSSGQATPGWALDLGCGSGLSSRYLARHGFRVIGVDLALSALARACRGAIQAGLPAYFCLGDVTSLGFLKVRGALALDIGCFHAISPERRAAYIQSVAERLAPEALYLLYAFALSLEPGDAPPGIGPREIACFAPHFSLRWVQHGYDRERRSAWYLLQRGYKSG